MENKKFAAVLVDPKILGEFEYDFLGVNSVTLPALFELFARKGTALLDSSVLHKIIKRNIGKSALVTELRQLNNVCDGFDFSKLDVGDVDKAASVIKGVDLHGQLVERFEQLYANAIMMPSCNTDEALATYYAQIEPFQDVSEEFSIADAFIMTSFIDYANQHSEQRFLVISGIYKDWDKVLQNINNVTVMYAAEDIMATWLPENAFARQLYKRFKQKVEDKMNAIVQRRDYVIANHGEIRPQVCFKRADIYERVMSPLQVTDNAAYYRVDAYMTVDGDYKRSYCMFEDDRWYEMNDTSASVTFEVVISYDKPDITSTAALSNVKIIDRGAIPVYVDVDD